MKMHKIVDGLTNKQLAELKATICKEYQMNEKTLVSEDGCLYTLIGSATATMLADFVKGYMKAKGW